MISTILGGILIALGFVALHHLREIAESTSESATHLDNLQKEIVTHAKAPVIHVAITHNGVPVNPKVAADVAAEIARQAARRSGGRP